MHDYQLGFESTTAQIMGYYDDLVDSNMGDEWHPSAIQLIVDYSIFLHDAIDRDMLQATQIVPYCGNRAYCLTIRNPFKAYRISQYVTPIDVLRAMYTTKVTPILAAVLMRHLRHSDGQPYEGDELVNILTAKGAIINIDVNAYAKEVCQQYTMLNKC